MSVSRVIEKVMHGWTGRGWKRRLPSRPRQSFTLQTANVLNYLPKSVQNKAKADLHAIYKAASRAAAEVAFGRFLAKYQAKYDKAAGCLAKDREALLAFYDFPAEHWKHVRSTNPVESTFATVRLRTDKTNGCLSRKTVTLRRRPPLRVW
jgi:putative transposase